MSSIHRPLNPKETEEFRQWARENFIPGLDKISNAWHPVVKNECLIIIDEATIHNGRCYYRMEIAKMSLEGLYESIVEAWKDLLNRFKTMYDVSGEQLEGNTVSMCVQKENEYGLDCWVLCKQQVV